MNSKNELDPMTSSNQNKMDRFSKISEKINQISQTGNSKNPQKFEKIESKINEVEENFNTN